MSSRRSVRQKQHGRLTPIEHFAHNGATLIDEVLGATSSRHIIFLHGWGGNRESLRGIGTLFQHTHQVHLLDLPGFGEAPPPPPDWDTINYTDLVQQYVLERLSGPVILVGHSFGGRVSVRLAARRLPQIRGLVLMGVPGLPQPPLSRTRPARAGDPAASPAADCGQADCRAEADRVAHPQVRFEGLSRCRRAAAGIHQSRE